MKRLRNDHTPGDDRAKDVNGNINFNFQRLLVKPHNVRKIGSLITYENKGRQVISMSGSEHSTISFQSSDQEPNRDRTSTPNAINLLRHLIDLKWTGV
jgi:hypothetical protein